MRENYKYELTQVNLDKAEADGKQKQVIAYGFVHDTPAGINYWNTGKEHRWVITLGGIGDWALYVGGACETIDEVRRHGDKMPLSCVSNFILATEEVYRKYRR